MSQENLRLKAQKGLKFAQLNLDCHRGNNCLSVNLDFTQLSTLKNTAQAGLESAIL